MLINGMQTSAPAVVSGRTMVYLDPDIVRKKKRQGYKDEEITRIKSSENEFRRLVQLDFG